MERSTRLSHDPHTKSHTVITRRSIAVAARSKDVSVPDIVIPHSSGSRGGTSKLSYCSWEGIRGCGGVGTAILISCLQQS